LSSLLCNIALEYVIKKVQENPGGTETEEDTSASGLYYVNELGSNIGIIKKNTETVTDDTKEADLEINIEKT
jgi:hypothetical protein